MLRKDVYALIDGEREYQERKWPREKHKHSVGSFLTYMHHYLTRIIASDSTADQSGEDHFLSARADMRKFAALAVACLEQNGPMTRARAFSLVEDECRSGCSEWLCGDDEFSRYLTILRYLMRKADTEDNEEGSFKSSLVVRLIAAIAVRCIADYGAPPR